MFILIFFPKKIFLMFLVSSVRILKQVFSFLFFLVLCVFWVMDVLLSFLRKIVDFVVHTILCLTIAVSFIRNKFCLTIQAILSLLALWCSFFRTFNLWNSWFSEQYVWQWWMGSNMHLFFRWKSLDKLNDREIKEFGRNFNSGPASYLGSFSERWLL